MLERDIIETIEKIADAGDEAIVKKEKGKVVVLQSTRRLRFKEDEPEVKNKR